MWFVYKWTRSMFTLVRFRGVTLHSCNHFKCPGVIYAAYMEERPGKTILQEVQEKCPFSWSARKRTFLLHFLQDGFTWAWVTTSGEAIVITIYVQNLYMQSIQNLHKYIAITNYVQYIAIIKLLKNQNSSIYMSEKFLVISTNCFCVNCSIIQ